MEGAEPPPSPAEAEQPLPAGWKIKKSRRDRGKVFYINSYTGKSQLKRPTEPPPEARRGAALRGRRRRQAASGNMSLASLATKAGGTGKNNKLLMAFKNRKVAAWKQRAMAAATARAAAAAAKGSDSSSSSSDSDDSDDSRRAPPPAPPPEPPPPQKPEEKEEEEEAEEEKKEGEDEEEEAADKAYLESIQPTFTAADEEALAAAIGRARPAEHPKALPAHAEAGILLAKKQDWAEAVTRLRRCRDGGIEEGAMFRALGRSLLGMWQTMEWKETAIVDEAYYAYESALKYSEQAGDPAVLAEMAEVYTRSAAFDGAVRIYARIIEEFPSQDETVLAHVIHRAALGLFKVKQYGEAAKYLSYLLETPPTPLGETEVLFEMGRVYDLHAAQLEVSVGRYSPQVTGLREMSRDAFVKVFRKQGQRRMRSTQPGGGGGGGAARARGGRAGATSAVDMWLQDPETWMRRGKRYARLGRMIMAVDLLQQSVSLRTTRLEKMTAEGRGEEPEFQVKGIHWTVLVDACVKLPDLELAAAAAANAYYYDKYDPEVRRRLIKLLPDDWAPFLAQEEAAAITWQRLARGRKARSIARTLRWEKAERLRKEREEAEAARVAAAKAAAEEARRAEERKAEEIRMRDKRYRELMQRRATALEAVDAQAQTRFLRLAIVTWTEAVAFLKRLAKLVAGQKENFMRLAVKEWAAAARQIKEEKRSAFCQSAAAKYLKRVVNALLVRMITKWHLVTVQSLEATRMARRLMGGWQIRVLLHWRNAALDLIEERRVRTATRLVAWLRGSLLRADRAVGIIRDGAADRRERITSPSASAGPPSVSGARTTLTSPAARRRRLRRPRRPRRRFGAGLSSAASSSSSSLSGGFGAGLLQKPVEVLHAEHLTRTRALARIPTSCTITKMELRNMLKAMTVIADGAQLGLSDARLLATELTRREGDGDGDGDGDGSASADDGATESSSKKLPPYGCNTTALMLHNGRIGNRGLYALAQALRRRIDIPLTTLSLAAQRGVGSAGIKSLATGLRQASSAAASTKSARGKGVQRLLMENLPRCGDAGAMALAKTVRSATCRLRELVLRQCNLGDRGAKMIGEALSSNSTIRSLNLSGNHIGDEGAEAIGNGMGTAWSRLAILRLGHNAIGEDGARAIGDAAPSNARMMEIDLQSNQVGDQGAISLAAALEACRNMTTLRLDRNQIGEFGIDAVADAVRRIAATASYSSPERHAVRPNSPHRRKGKNDNFMMLGGRKKEHVPLSLIALHSNPAPRCAALQADLQAMLEQMLFVFEFGPSAVFRTAGQTTKMKVGGGGDGGGSSTDAWGEDGSRRGGAKEEEEGGGGGGGGNMEKELQRRDEAVGRPTHRAASA